MHFTCKAIAQSLASNLACLSQRIVLIGQAGVRLVLLESLLARLRKSHAAPAQQKAAPELVPAL
jgi:hypothetical protein